MEYWRPINGFDNYLVSSDGNVMSKPRPKTRGGLVKQHDGTSGNMIVHIFDNNKRRQTKQVHRLVAEAFLPNFFGHSIIDHKNRNRKDNRLFNLRWCNKIQNSLNTKLRDDNTSGCKGVCYDNTRGKWIGIVYLGKKTIRKRFKTKEEAIAFRNNLVKIHYDPNFYTEM